NRFGVGCAIVIGDSQGQGVATHTEGLCSCAACGAAGSRARPRPGVAGDAAITVVAARCIDGDGCSTPAASSEDLVSGWRSDNGSRLLPYTTLFRSNRFGVGRAIVIGDSQGQGVATHAEGLRCAAAGCAAGSRARPRPGV